MNKPRVLLVDDEPDILAVARIALEKFGGFSVDACGGGREALARAAASPPDLVLLDVMMPGLDGPSTLRGLRENPATASIPVVFMTAKVQPPEMRRYLELGVRTVIPKPFDPLDLASQLKAVLAAPERHETC
jgi:CheY-like chemotaxis protein